MLLIKTKTENKKISKESKAVKLNFFSRIASSQEREYLIENLSMLVASGMAIASALESIETELQSRRMKKVVASIRRDVDEGLPLWSALEKTKMLPSYEIALIKLGEKSGRLSDNLLVINIQETKEADFRNKISAAISYPVFVLFFVSIVGVAVAWLILPRLVTIFEQMNFQLPALTRGILWLGHFLGQYGWQVMLAFLLAIFIFYFFLFFYSRTRFLGQKLIFSFPVIRRFIQQIQLSRFGYILGTLLEAGLPIVDALDSLQSTAGFYHYRKFYLYLQSSLDSGNSFQKSFLAYKNSHRLIPGPVQQMIVAGEQSGKLPETFLKIGSNFEKKIDISAKNFSNILEPVMLVLVGLGVALVAMGIILPIYGLIGNL